MTNTNQAPAYKKPWVVAKDELDILQAKAERHGLKVEIVANPGDCFAIGSAECEIGDSQLGVWVLGDKALEPEADIDFFHEVDDAWNERRRSGGPKEAPV